MFRVLFKLFVIGQIGWLIWANVSQIAIVKRTLVTARKKVATQVDLKHVGSAVRSYYQTYQSLPTDLRYVVRTYATQPDPEVRPGQDRWGSDLQIVPTADGVYLVSPGPDCTAGTRDDQRRKVSLVDLGYGRAGSGR